MEKIYLHDVPVDLFADYYLNNPDNNFISQNARYQPKSLNYTIDKYFQYVYVINEKAYSIKMAKTPRYEYDTSTIKLLFGLDDDEYFNCETIIPKLNANFKTKFYAIPRNEESINTFIDENFTIDNEFTVLSSDSTEEQPEYEKASIYHSSNGSSGIIESANTPVYYIPINDTISNELEHLNLYPYYAVIKNKILSSIVKNGDEFYFVYNDSGDSAQSEKITTLFGLSITIGTEIFQNKADNTKYYPVYDVTTDKICGKIYILPPYKIPEITNGKYIFIDSYTNSDILFEENTLPLTPIVKYHNYMKNLTKTTSEVYSGTMTDNPNNLYFIKYLDSTSIVYDFKYEKVINSLNNRVTKKVNNNETVSVIDYYSEANTVINWVKTKNYNINPVYSMNNNSLNMLDFSSADPLTAITVNEKHLLTTSEITATNKYITDPDFTTDNVRYTFRTLFSTNKMFTISNPKKYGIYSTISPTATYLLVNNKENFSKFLSMNEKYSFIKFGDDIFYFTTKIEPQDNALIGNGVYYKLELAPLGKYIYDQVNSIGTNTSSNIYSTESISSGRRISYSVDNSINFFTDDDLSSTGNKLKSLTKLADIQKIFAAKKLFKDYSLIKTPIVENSSEQYSSKKLNAFLEIYKNTIESQTSNIFNANILNKYTLNEYITSLLKNIIYIFPNNQKENDGGYCLDKRTSNTYHGFIDYENAYIFYNYLNKDVSKSNTKSVKVQNLSDFDKESIRLEVAAKNPIERLSNFKKYPLNITEELVKRKIKSDENDLLNSMTATNFVLNKKIDTNNKIYGSLTFSIAETVNKCLDLYTEYLYFNNDTQDQDKIIDEYDINSLPFYRRNIINYLDKLLDSSNDYIYNNKNEYNIKYIFNNDELDTETFFKLLTL